MGFDLTPGFSLGVEQYIHSIADDPNKFHGDLLKIATGVVAGAAFTGKQIGRGVGLGVMIAVPAAKVVADVTTEGIKYAGRSGYDTWRGTDPINPFKGGEPIFPEPGAQPSPPPTAADLGEPTVITEDIPADSGAGGAVIVRDMAARIIRARAGYIGDCDCSLPSDRLSSGCRQVCGK